ncbi:AraC family transcriptional regulator [Sinomonas cyclohexanicum]|uniref:AraC family transcriptional regulator n=1 Tax=Sinomonas cyclohexanicum TaxID=322009 RepID=A0ABN6FLE1_SINCY|nr:AraC family transcriptional regulator [Corynebacterium cyclohexanicum]BCT76628.1 AraC family transcriptional regulator [Corynebacterium cyclohexanicum]
MSALLTPRPTVPARPAAAPAGLDVTVARDFDSWRRAVSASFVPLAVEADHRGSFEGTMRGTHLAAEDLSMIEVAAGRHTVLRTPELVAASERKYFKLSIQLAGTGLLMQDGREAVLTPGNLAVYSTDRPYTLAFDGDFRSLVLMFPHSALDLPADAMAQVTATGISGTDGLGGLVAPFLVRLSENLETIAGPNGARLVNNALDLVTTLFNGELDARSAVSRDPHQMLLARIHDYVEAHLPDPDLAPGAIAAAHFISTRHLHDLFRELGTTVSASIRERRLERCRRDLRDPVLADRPVTAIASRWGLTDSAHFSRIFRAAYGEPPTAYRAGGR